MRTIIVISLFLCVGAGHYLLGMVPAEGGVSIGLISRTALCCLCLFGALCLVLQSRGERLHGICAFQAAIVALAVLASLAARLFFSERSAADSMLSPTVILFGGAFACLLVFFPLELTRPGWLTVRRAGLLFLPLVVLAAIYGAVVLRWGTFHELRVWSDLTQNIWEFDVWFRLLLLSYPVWLLWLLRFRAEDSPGENKRWRLLNNYRIGLVLLLASHLVVAMSGSAQGRMWHGMVFLGFMSYLLYQTLFNLPSSTGESYAVVSGDRQAAKPAPERDSHSFDGMIPQYKKTLEQWMQTQKPYCNPSFKLLDCMSVLPLNRSYLSRLFNEGYEETFFTYVMRRRIEESIRLLDGQPEQKIARISELCGFSSPSVFGRAFLKNTGMTPLQYRRKNLLENKAG